MLRQLLDHLRQVSHILAVAAADILVLVELLQLLGDVLGHHCNVLEQRELKVQTRNVTYISTIELLLLRKECYLIFQILINCIDESRFEWSGYINIC